MKVSTSHFDLYLSFQRGTTPVEAPEKNNNQPHIVVFLDKDDSKLIQYFVSVEQEPDAVSPWRFSTVSVHTMCLT